MSSTSASVHIVLLFEALEATAGVNFPTLDPSGAASSEVRSSLF